MTDDRGVGTGSCLHRHDGLDTHFAGWHPQTDAGVLGVVLSFMTGMSRRLQSTQYHFFYSNHLIKSTHLLSIDCTMHARCGCKGKIRVSGEPLTGLLRPSPLAWVGLEARLEDY